MSHHAELHPIQAHSGRLHPEAIHSISALDHPSASLSASPDEGQPVKKVMRELKALARTAAPKTDAELQAAIEQLGQLYDGGAAQLPTQPDHRQPHLRELKEAYIAALIQLVDQAGIMVNLTPRQAFEHYRADIRSFAQLDGQASGEPASWLDGLSIVDAPADQEFLQGIRRASRRARSTAPDELDFRFGTHIPEFMQPRLANVAQYLLRARLTARERLLKARETIQIKLDFRDLEGQDIGVYRFSFLKDPIGKSLDSTAKHSQNFKPEIGIEYLGTAGLTDRDVQEPDDETLEERLTHYQLALLDRPNKLAPNHPDLAEFKAWTPSEKQALLRGLSALPTGLLERLRGTQFLRRTKGDHEQEAGYALQGLNVSKSIVITDRAFVERLHQASPGQRARSSFEQTLFHEIAHVDLLTSLLPDGQAVSDQNADPQRVSAVGSSIVNTETGIFLEEQSWGDIRSQRAAASDGLLPPDSDVWQQLFRQYFSAYLKQSDQFIAKKGQSLARFFEQLHSRLEPLLGPAARSGVKGFLRGLDVAQQAGTNSPVTSQATDSLTEASSEFKRLIIEAVDREAHELWTHFLSSPEVLAQYHEAPERYPHITARLSLLEAIYGEGSYSYASGFRLTGASKDYQKTGLTPYGKTDLEESYAVAFSLFISDPVLLQALRPELAEWFEQHCRQK